MKIGFLGNTNNYPFIIASQMKNLGYETIMYVDVSEGSMLHRPEHFSNAVSYPYPDWIKEKTSLGKSLTFILRSFSKGRLSGNSIPAML